MEFPEDLKYSKEHIWVRIEKDSAFIGITDYAQQELGIITGVELPDEGDELEQDDSFGSLEARKTVADLYAPFSGTVRSINHEAMDNPVIINDDPYDSGWLVEVLLDDAEELKGLMSPDDYSDFVENSD